MNDDIILEEEANGDDACDCCDDDCDCGDCEQCGKDDDVDEDIAGLGIEKEEEPASNLYGKAVAKDDDYDDGYRDDL